jgi:hypothetical protein
MSRFSGAGGPVCIYIEEEKSKMSELLSFS